MPYELVLLDRQKNENRTPAYLALSPAGKVPALVDDGQPYFESLAILLHLGETYGRELALWPATGPARADALCWSVWGTTELHAYMMQFLYHGLDTPVSYAPDQRSKATADYNHGQLLRLLDVLDERLAAREHLLGSFSLADIPAAQALMFGTSPRPLSGGARERRAVAGALPGPACPGARLGLTATPHRTAGFVPVGRPGGPLHRRMTRQPASIRARTPCLPWPTSPRATSPPKSSRAGTPNGWRAGTSTPTPPRPRRRSPSSSRRPT